MNVYGRRRVFSFTGADILKENNLERPFSRTLLLFFVYFSVFLQYSDLLIFFFLLLLKMNIFWKPNELEFRKIQKYVYSLNLFHR